MIGITFVAASSSSAIVSEASGATAQGSTHDFVSDGSAPASALSRGTGGQTPQQRQATTEERRWQNPRKGSISDWVDFPDSLKSILPFLGEMKCLQQMGRSISQLKELPWVDMAHTVAKHVCTQRCTLFASCSMNLPQLSEYILELAGRQ